MVALLYIIFSSNAVRISHSSRHTNNFLFVLTAQFAARGVDLRCICFHLWMRITHAYIRGVGCFSINERNQMKPVASQGQLESAAATTTKVQKFRRLLCVFVFLSLLLLLRWPQRRDPISQKNAA
jgi:hypothetical protein